MFTLGNPTIFGISLNDEYPAALAKKALRMVIRFATSYLREAGLSAMTTGVGDGGAGVQSHP